MHTLAQNLMGYANLHLLPVSTDSTCLLILCTHIAYSNPATTHNGPRVSQNGQRDAASARATMRTDPIPDRVPLRAECAKMRARHKFAYKTNRIYNVRQRSIRFILYSMYFGQ